MQKKHCQVSIFIALLTLSCATVFAQQRNEPLLEELRGVVKSKPINVSALFQTGADFQSERSFAGNNGFSLSNIRVNVSGELDEKFGYFTQVNFVRSPAVLDAKISYRAIPAIAFDMGLFKAPFSRELLTGAANIDFVNRSQVVSALAPGRQLGFQIRSPKTKGTVWDELFSYGLGVFNGNGFGDNNNDDGNFMVVGRFNVSPEAASGGNSSIDLGVNAGYSKDTSVRVVTPDFKGDRLLSGVDARLTFGNLLLSGEAIYVRLSTEADEESDLFGYHATVGYALTDHHQFLVRWDSLMPDELKADSNLLILGYNFTPTQAAGIQVNYVLPTDDFDVEQTQLLVNAQIAF